MTHYFKNDYNLKEEPKIITYNYRDLNFSFQTNSGVFSKREIDFGSELLLNAFVNDQPIGSILDLGCGYGYLGIVINKFTNNNVDMVDINERAVMLAESNIRLNDTINQVWVSDGFANITKKYKYIITNPPVRVGKAKMYELLIGAKQFLTKDGELWLVIRKEQGAKTLIKDMQKEYLIKIVNKKSGFYIIKASIA